MPSDISILISISSLLLVFYNRRSTIDITRSCYKVYIISMYKDSPALFYRD
jgi:hypothetical protein